MQHIDERLMLKDSINAKNAYSATSLWADTEVIGGYDLNYSLNGKSTLGKTLFTKRNTVPIGGVQNVMELLFGVQGPIIIPTLYDQHGIGLPNSPASVTKYKTPKGEKNVIYPYGRELCLFGVGITGTAENTLTEYPVDYRENDITMEKRNTDGTTLTGIQLPFRYTKVDLSPEDKKKYYGKLRTSTGETAFYLKSFERDVRIKHIWKSANILETDDDQEEVEVTNDDVWDLERSDKVSTFAECIIRITKKDLREYFIATDQADQMRFNSIALYTGRYVETTDRTGVVTSADYEDVRLFSKVNIPMEPMKLEKDFYAIYRVYGR